MEFQYSFDGEGYELKKNEHDSGYDLRVMSMKEENDYLICDFGIMLEPPQDHYFELFPRSSLFKTGYILTNSVGVIDNSYRGHVKAILRKIGEGKKIEIGDRICQIILKKQILSVPVRCDKLSETERGNGGFGSTGKN